MNRFDRRQFIKAIAGSAAVAALPFSSKVNALITPPRVVVVGGGFAGATVAKYLRMWGSNVDVTMVDPATAHVSCVGSNLVLNGRATLSSLTKTFTKLRDVHGVKLKADTVVQVDPPAKRVYLASGQYLDYDRLILAPGIEFDTIPGLDPNKITHAWKAGPQTTQLKNQLAAMPAGKNFVLSIPAAPYRCPPGPYERACVVADLVKRTKPGSKVIVLDANPDITAEKHTFSTAFSGIYSGIVEYHPGATVLSADSANMILDTSIGKVGGAVINVIPAQRAGAIVAQAGLVPAGQRWAPVNPLSYESNVVPGIHVIGDSQATGQPKSAHMANAQAKVCADAIIRAFAGLEPYASPKTNSACYSPITYDKASWLTVVFGYDPATKTMKAVPGTLTEAPSPTKDNFEQMGAWSANLFADTFA
jgi:NADPH-dependent 2,4-dienoyl-CoA reductase/sulfur reductase-like enzyme